MYPPSNTPLSFEPIDPGGSRREGPLGKPWGGALRGRSGGPPPPFAIRHSPVGGVARGGELAHEAVHEGVPRPPAHPPVVVRPVLWDMGGGKGEGRGGDGAVWGATVGRARREGVAGIIREVCVISVLIVWALAGRAGGQAFPRTA